MTRTFLDAGVLIAAIRGTPEIAERALALLDEPERVFVSSDLVQLEVLPKAVYFRHTAEAAFYRAYFASVMEMVPVSQTLVTQASEQVQQADLAAMDVLPSPRQELARQQSSLMLGLFPAWHILSDAMSSCLTT